MVKRQTQKEMTAKVKVALRKRFCMPEWATFFEVYGETGRQADCVSINMFPSRNHKVLGFEIKSSRNDWLKELKNGEKADFFVGQCDEWYIVEARPDIVKKDELPEGWGLYTLKNDQLRRKKRSKIDYRRPISRQFYTSMIRQAYNQGVDEWEVLEIERKGIESGRKEALENDFNLKHLEDQEKIVDKLRNKGIPIWNHSDEQINSIAEAVKLINMLKKSDFKSIPHSLKSLRSGIKRFRESVDDTEKIYYKLLGMTKNGERGND